MKGVWLALLALLPVGCACAKGLVYASDKLEKTTFVASPYQSEISYQSQDLPAWQFGVRYDRTVPYHTQWLDSIYSYHIIDSVKLSASRRIIQHSTQRIFAEVQTSSNYQNGLVDWQTLPQNAGNAASLGWQIGDNRSINMAVKYEFRALRDIDINSLSLGVHYYF